MSFDSFMSLSPKKLSFCKQKTALCIRYQTISSGHLTKIKECRTATGIVAKYHLSDARMAAEGLGFDSKSGGRSCWRL
jgi:hypothetical protein